MSPWNNPSDSRFTGRTGWDVPKRSPNTRGDFVLTGIIVGVFGVIIAINLLM